MTPPNITPGPWKWQGTRGKPHIKAHLSTPDDYVLADTSGLDITEDDARAIAALPQVLKSLADAYKLLEGPVADLLTGDSMHDAGVYDTLTLMREALIDAGYTEI